jgi:hypothetical protein
MKKNLISLMITNHPSNNKRHPPSSLSLNRNKLKVPLTILTMMKTFHTSQRLQNHSRHVPKLLQNQRRRTRNNSSTAMTKIIDILIAGKFIVK